MDIGTKLFADVEFIDMGDLHVAVFVRFARWRIVNAAGREILKRCAGRTVAEIISDLPPQYQYLNADGINTFLASFIEEGFVSSEKDIQPDIDDSTESEEVYRLTNVGLNLTESCNLSCIHCFIDSGPKRDRSAELSDQMVLDTVDKLLTLGTPDFFFSGGEPLLRKDLLMKVIQKLRGHSTENKIKVITNGTLLDRHVCHFFASNNIDVQVSLDGATPAVHDQIRGKGVFRKTVRGLKMLVACGANTSTCTTVMRQNIDTIIDTVNFAISMGVGEVQTQLMIPVGKANENIDRISIDPDIGLSVMGDAKRIAEAHDAWGYEKCSQYSIREGRRYRPCDIGAYLYITSDGDIYPCAGMYHPSMKMGNIIKDEICEIWYKNETLKRLRGLTVHDFKECRDCAYRYFCGGGCRGDVLLVKGNMFSANPFCKSERRIIMKKISEDAIQSLSMNKGYDLDVRIS